MSVENSTEEGVLLLPEKFRPLFRSNIFAKATAQKLLERRFATLRALGDEGRLLVQQIWDDGDPEVLEYRGDVVERLKQVQSGDELFAILCDCLYAEQKGQSGKYGDTFFEDTTGLLNLWNEVIASYNFVTKQNIPYIDEIVTFGSARKSGLWDVEYGHPYFYYSTGSIFVRVLTEPGKSLSGGLGIIPEVTEWVEESC